VIVDKPPTPVPSENVPSIKQARLIGVLYLEKNNQTSHVFTPARLAVLKLLASQAAISLETPGYTLS
jgi:GAF domain-containing protein